MMSSSIINIEHVNANSLRSKEKQHHLQTYLDQEKPIALLVSETKLNEKFKIALKGYVLIRTDRTTNTGGGTGILLRNDIIFEELNQPTIKSIEFTAVKIKLNDSMKIILIAAYVKPSTTLNGNDLSKLLSSFGNINTIFAADLNAKHTNWNNRRNNPSGCVLKDWMEINMQHFNVIFPEEHTCLRRNTTPSTLDCFIISTSLTNDNIPKISTKDFLSDHRAIQLQLELNDKIIYKDPQMARNWAKCNWNTFNVTINAELDKLDIPDNKNLGEADIDFYISEIGKIFSLALDKSCPMVILNRSRLITLSTRSLALVSRKKRIRNKLFRLRNNANFFSVEQDLRNEIQHLNIMIRNSIADDYRSHFVNKLKSLDTRNSNIFTEIQKLSKYKNQDALPNTMKNETETISYTTDLQKTNGFASHFEKINNITFTGNDTNFETEVNNEIENWFNANKNNSIVQFSNEMKSSDPYDVHSLPHDDPSIRFIEPGRLKQIVKSRNNKKSTGADGITSKMLKVLSPFALIQLTIIFNNIINLGYFPKTWRHGIVIPVYKKGKNKHHISSYRPIQLLSNLGKLLEKHISDTILNYNDKFKIFPDFQFAYQKGKSTTHPLVILSDTIAKNLGGLNKVPTYVLTLDFEKAFDLLWVEGLIWKCIRLYNFSTPTAKIIYSFMKNRSFQVRLNNCKSETKYIEIGSPQGSSISAFAFLLFTSDFPKPTNENMKKLSYADDTAIIVSEKDVFKAESTINEYLSKVINYTNRFKLKLNKSKCELLVILGRWADIGQYTREKLKIVNIVIEGHKLKLSKEIKYLGITYNKQFHFRTHIDERLKKANNAYYSCKNLFHNKVLDCKVKSLLYKSLIRSIISYGFAAWNSINSFNMEKIRKFERKMLRACTQLYRKEDSTKYINSSKVYNAANCKRFDVFVNDVQMKFFEKLDETNDINTAAYAQCTNFEEMSNQRYKSPAYMYELAKNNLLMEDSKLLYYNKNRHNQIAYVTEQ